MPGGPQFGPLIIQAPKAPQNPELREKNSKFTKICWNFDAYYCLFVALCVYLLVYFPLFICLCICSSNSLFMNNFDHAFDYVFDYLFRNLFCCLFLSFSLSFFISIFIYYVRVGVLWIWGLDFGGGLYQSDWIVSQGCCEPLRPVRAVRPTLCRHSLAGRPKFTLLPKDKPGQTYKKTVQCTHVKMLSFFTSYYQRRSSNDTKMYQTKPFL